MNDQEVFNYSWLKNRQWTIARQLDFTAYKELTAYRPYCGRITFIERGETLHIFLSAYGQTNRGVYWFEASSFDPATGKVISRFMDPLMDHSIYGVAEFAFDTPGNLYIITQTGGKLALPPAFQYLIIPE